MAHTSEHLAVLGNIERYYASEKRGRRSIKLLEQLKRFFCLGILFFCEKRENTRVASRIGISVWYWSVFYRYEVNRYHLKLGKERYVVRR